MKTFTLVIQSISITLAFAFAIWLILTGIAIADCKIAAICGKDGAQLSINCGGFQYDNCNAELVTTEDGKVYNQIMCCSSEKDKCIYLLLPTDKIGT